MSEIDQILSAVLEAADDYDFDADDVKDAGQPGDYGEAMDLMNRGLLEVSMVVSRSGRYYHERSTGVDYEIQFYLDEAQPDLEQRIEALFENVYKALKERMVDWNKKIYSELEASYESMFEDDYVEEEIRANERTYDEEGEDDGDIPYDQLSPEAQEHARESWKNATREDPDDFWSEHVIAEWKWLLTNKGFGNIEINWSGFYSQGDGASFTGKVVDWVKFFQGPDPLEFPEQEREQIDEGLEDEDDFKDLASSERKPWGWLIKSTWTHTDANGKVWKSPSPWLNTRRGEFMRYISDGTVFKRFKTTQQWPELEAVPIYGDPRKYGDKVLDPLFQEPPPRRSQPMPPWQDDPIQERYGGAAKEKALYFHGTSAALIPRIMSEGLVPDPKKRVWDKDENTSINSATRQTIFGIGLSRQLGNAISDGNTAARRDKANLAIICVIAQPRSLIADEDSVSYLLKNLGGNIGDSIYHHIWPYFMEVYRQQYIGYHRTNEGLEDDDFEIADEKDITAPATVHDDLTKSAAEQKAKWVDGAVQFLMSKLPGASEQLINRVRQIIADEGYAAMLTRAVAYAGRKEGDWAIHKWDSEWREYFPSNIPAPPVPDVKHAERQWLLFIEKLSRTLKDYARKWKMHKDWGWSVEGRATKTIGFTGANRITCIVEQITQREPSYHSQILVH